VKTKYLHTLFILFLFLLTHLVVAQPIEKKYQSLLWEIKHPDNPSKTSYIYGTMHVSKRLAFNLSDTFFLGLQNADVIALESDPAQWMEEVMNPKYATEYFGSYPSYTSTSRGFYQRIFAHTPPTNDQIGSLIASRDLMINNLQYRNNPYMLDFEEDTYLDMFIYMTGKRTGRRVVGLENFMVTNDLHRTARSERRTKKDEKPIPVWLEDMMKEQNLGSIFENSYRMQNLDLMMALLEIFQSDHYTHYFLNERNRLMVDSMVVLMKNNSVFAGVGAAHLAGSKGMIEYLRGKGCSVRPVKFLKTDFANEEKKRIDSLKVDLALTPQVSPDKQFSVSLPAKLYELPYSGKHYLCSDMINGSFFSVQKINTYNYLSGLTPEIYLEKIDSLLFENIPGTILSENKIQNGPYKGIEVKNRTRTGNLQHYQIYATPFEIIIFKVGGTGDFISKWSDSIFATLTFDSHPAKNAEWIRQSFVYGGFSVETPPLYIQDNNNPISALYNNPLYQSYEPKTGNFFLVTRNLLMDFFFIEEDKFELERTADKLAKKHKQEISCKKIGTHDGYPCIDFVLTDTKKQKVSYRMIINGGFYYLLVAKVGSDDKTLTKFIKSFRIEPLINPAPFENFKDTFLYFNTLTSKELNESEIRMSSRFEKPKEYQDFSETYVYESETGERVRVYMKKFHEYDYYPSADSIFNEDLKDIAEDNSQFLLWSKRNDNAHQYVVDAMFADTGSIRSIKMRIIVNKTGDRKYTLRALTDTLSKTSSFMESFFNNFATNDTSLGISVFQNKGKIFLEDMFSGDTTRFKKAMSSLNHVTLTPDDVSQVIQILETYDFAKNDELYLKYTLLNQLVGVKHDTLLSYSESLYNRNTNNYPIQISALAILCSQKSKEAVQILKKIMQEDLPYVMDEDKYILSPLRIKKMELWKELYPEMFEFDHIAEYKNIIMYDLSLMLDSGVIEASFYQSFIPRLLNESEFVLKKHIAKEQKKAIDRAKTQAVDEKKSSYGTGFKNTELVMKYKLLLPHIQNAVVKEIIQAYDKNIQSEADRIEMIRLRLQKKQDVNTQEIATLAKNLDALLDLYKVLYENNKINLLPSSSQNLELLAKLTLNESKGGYGFWGTKFDFDRDTFKLIKTEVAEQNGRKYNVYYHQINQFISTTAAQKTNFVAKDFQRLSYIAIEVKDGRFNPDGNNYTTTVKIENPERIQKYLEEMNEEFIVRTRPRASAEEVGDENDFYDY
jgi:uncharacterized protein YbaP (TraB family)